MQIDPRRVAARIVEARESRGMTQRVLAERLDVSHTTLWRYETDVIPPVSVLCEIASLTNKPLSFFLEGQRDVIVVRNTLAFAVLERFDDRSDAWREISWLLDSAERGQVRAARARTGRRPGASAAG